MSGQAPQQQDQSSSMDFLWGAVAIVAAILATWFFGKNYIISFLFTLKLWQIKLVSFFVPRTAELIPYLDNYRHFPQELSFISFKFFMTSVGKFISYPIAALFFLLGGFLLFGNFAQRFNKIFTMQSLYDAEKKDWPQITPISKVNLVKEPIDKGPWAMALSPMDFAKKYRLLKEINEIVHGAKVSERGSRIRIEIIRSRALAVFAAQLGPEWEGIDALPIYSKALFACFVAKANQDRDASRILLNRIARSSEGGKLDFTGTEALLKKHKNCKVTAKIITGHAYITTVMASMLEFARTDGVFASADFLWLKPVDRRLWYLLNCVGRQTPFAEVAGPFAHWLVEKELMHRITTPMVEEAVNGLEIALADIIYTKNEE